MIEKKQLFRHRPEDGIYGDCHRTAIACILDLDPEQVPQFGLDLEMHKPRALRQDEEANIWLEQYDMRLFDVLFTGELPLEDVLSTVGGLNPGLYYLLGGISRNGVAHTVICRDNRIVWDPALDDSGIVAPMKDGYWWISIFAHRRACR